MRKSNMKFKKRTRLIQGATYCRNCDRRVGCGAIVHEFENGEWRCRGCSPANG